MDSAVTLMGTTLRASKVTVGTEIALVRTFDHTIDRQ